MAPTKTSQFDGISGKYIVGTGTNVLERDVADKDCVLTLCLVSLWTLDAERRG